VQRGEEEHRRPRFRAEQQGRGTEEEQGGAPPRLSSWREALRPMVLCGAPRPRPKVRAEHRVEGKEPGRSTKASPKNRGPLRPRKGPRPQVLCGAPRNRGGTQRRGRRGAPRRGAGFVRSTEEPRGSTNGRPKRSTDARRRFRAEHRGTEGEH
jgi:hypothetical protein